jgi:benzoyl-CoA reductase/2-hydroxyglutaryl-CoA dehydratase subunit BcrC/BadD/HgdB
MLTEQEIMNNAFKELLFHEDNMAKKYAQLSEQITEPNLQQMLKGMEQRARNHYSTLSQTMSKFSIV